eukprot:7165549-Prymnesium_polylepis.1
MDEHWLGACSSADWQRAESISIQHRAALAMKQAVFADVQMHPAEDHTDLAAKSHVASSSPAHWGHPHGQLVWNQPSTGKRRADDASEAAAKRQAAGSWMRPEEPRSFGNALQPMA